MDEKTRSSKLRKSLNIVYRSLITMELPHYKLPKFKELELQEQYETFN